MIGHHHIAINQQPFPFLTKFQAFDDHVSIYLSTKYIHLSDHLKSHKIDSGLVFDLIGFWHEVVDCFAK